jgi:protein SCO1
MMGASRRSGIRRLASGILAIGLLLPALARAQAQNPPQGVLEGVGIDQKLGGEVPRDLAFRDEEGRSVRLGDSFRGKPVILSLVYFRCPMLCSYVMSGLVRSLRGISFSAGREFDILTVSFDPGDTPTLARVNKADRLKDYDRPGAEQGWRFLTGDESSIRALTDAVGFRYKTDPQTGQFAHAAAIMVLTPEGRLSHYFYGVEYAPRDLRLALVEASRSRIGTPADQVLLYCFHYDPATGKYGPAILNILRAAGGLTLLALGGLMLLLSRRARARRTREALT